MISELQNSGRNTPISSLTKGQAAGHNVHSFRALIKSYRKSPRYRNLKPRTGLDYDKHLDFFASIMGDRNPAKLQRKDVIRLRDANADKAYFANYSLRVLRVLMEHCVDLGWRETNPVRGVPELKTEKLDATHGRMSFWMPIATYARSAAENGS